MKHSVLVTAAGLCLFSFACGGAESSATPDGVGAGPQWYAPVEVAEAGATGSGALDPEADVLAATDELTLSSTWQLQLPNNSTSSNLNGDQLPYYYKASDGGRVFMDPDFGITTSGSQHPRTELREKGTWHASGTNSMTVTGKVLKSSSITIGQVFNQDNSITLAELQYTSSGFQVLYEEKKHEADPSYHLGGAFPVGQQYTFTMSLTKGTLTVTVNGKTFTKKPSSAVSGNNFYFKVGNYDQKSTKSTSVSGTVHSLVENYSVVVSHG